MNMWEIEAALKGINSIAKTVVGTPAAVPTAKSEYHHEEVVAGQELENYLKREADEDGLYVKVVSHEEWIEKIRQPATPEELSYIRERTTRRNRAWLIVGSVSIAAAGLVGAAYFNAVGKQSIKELHKASS